MLKYFEIKKAFRYYIKQVDSMLPYVWFSNRSQKTSKCGKNISDKLGYASCTTYLFLPHFDVIYDLLLNRHTATWNLFVKQIHLSHNKIIQLLAFKISTHTFRARKKKKIKEIHVYREFKKDNVSRSQHMHKSWIVNYGGICKSDKEFFAGLAFSQTSKSWAIQRTQSG